MAIDSDGKLVYCKPCKVVMVLTSSQGSGEARLFGDSQELYFPMRGVYRLDTPRKHSHEMPQSHPWEHPHHSSFDSIVDALTYIRDHGGECLAGEPLPEKPETTWKALDVREDTSGPGYRCGRCLAWSRDAVRRCPECAAKLSAPFEWIGWKL